jgi:MFS family permease
MSSQEEEQK